MSKNPLAAAKEAWQEFVDSTNETRKKYKEKPFAIGDKQWLDKKIGFFAGFDAGVQWNQEADKEEPFAEFLSRLSIQAQQQQIKKQQIREQQLEPHQVRHPYGDSYTGMLCGTLVLDKNGYGDECGLPVDHPVHKIREEGMEAV